MAAELSDRFAFILPHITHCNKIGVQNSTRCGCIRRSVRRLAWCLVTLAVLGVGKEANCAGPFGSPNPASDDRTDSSASIGAGYFFQRTTWKPDDNLNFGNIDIDRTAMFVQAGTLFSEESEVYLRVAAADLKQTGTGGFEGDYRPSGTVGYRGLWFGERRSAWGIGPIIQGSYAATYKDKSDVDGIVTEAEIRNPWDAALAVGIQYRIGEWLTAFGGPFGYYSSAKAKIVSQALGLELSTNFKEKNNFGGYGGVRFSPFRNLVVEAEGQYLGQYAFGVNVAYQY